jgi:flagellin
MPTILNNVTAMAASRQIGITNLGLKQAIERLTTGKRVNRASDDAAGMVNGTNFERQARFSREAVKGFQNNFFAAQALDGYLEEATNQAYRLAELEGSQNTTTAEYTAVLALASSAAVLGGSTAGTNSSSALSTINATRTALAASMATALSSANIEGIRAEGNFSQSDNIMGADIGAEMVNLTKYQILMQAGTSALTNANQASQVVLGLFR